MFSFLSSGFFLKDCSTDVGSPPYISSNPHHVNHDLIGFFHVPVGSRMNTDPLLLINGLGISTALGFPRTSRELIYQLN